MKLPTLTPKHCKQFNALTILALALWFFAIPACIVLNFLADPALTRPGVPKFAVWVHKHLSPRLEAWARDRVASGVAATLTTDDLVQTEWPMFGATFYLWATETLQQEYERDPSIVSAPPNQYARGAVAAATNLILDPNHAEWVRQHWGENYRDEENAFYRMMLVASLTSYQNLTGCATRSPMLAQIVDSLARDIDDSPAGLLEDYPGETYPGDVLTALAAIKRADPLLDADYSVFLERAKRGFSGRNLDPNGLVPYAAVAQTGGPVGPAQGCGNSYVSIFAPEIWPAEAAELYARYDIHYWDGDGFVSGFREFPRDIREYDWSMNDMDSGPIVDGMGMAASAFGLGAARANGRFDHARELATEMVATSWPLLDGTLLVPRLLSSASGAPYLGESCILFNLTRQPAPGVPITTGGRIPPLVHLSLSFYILTASLLITLALKTLLHLRKNPQHTVPLPKFQTTVWLLVLTTALLLLATNQPAPALIALLTTQFLPRTVSLRKARKAK